MNNYSGYGAGSGGSSATEKAQMMDQLKNQIAVANAQELVQVEREREKECGECGDDLNTYNSIHVLVCVFVTIENDQQMFYEVYIIPRDIIRQEATGRYILHLSQPHPHP